MGGVRPRPLGRFQHLVGEAPPPGMGRSTTREEMVHVDRSHILSARCCYRWKPTADGFKCKCRVVVAGFRDPHLALLARDSPVLTRAGFHLILLICSANYAAESPLRLVNGR